MYFRLPRCERERLAVADLGGAPGPAAMLRVWLADGVHGREDHALLLGEEAGEFARHLRLPACSGLHPGVGGT
jgi:hypothetical protein